MKIEIKGPIINDADQWIYDWFEVPATSPSKVNSLIDSAIRNQDSELLVLINSGGGSVFSAAEIYTALKSFVGKVKIQIVGMAASAASVISMAGSRIEMSPVAQIMIHNASTWASGDYQEMDYTSEFLQKVNQTIINAYVTKTTKTEAELKEMMDKTTWMTAQEAKEMGFIDAVMFESEIDAVASAKPPELVDGEIPRKVIDQLRQQLKKDPINTTTNAITQNEGGSKTMDLQTLKNDHPELVKQLVDEAVTNAVTAERQRIKDIEDLAVAGSEEIVQAAKFESGISAEKTAMEILKNEKVKKATALQNLQQDADPLNNIEPGALPQNTESKEQKVNNFVEDTLKNLGMWGGK